MSQAHSKILHLIQTFSPEHTLPLKQLLCTLTSPTLSPLPSPLLTASLKKSLQHIAHLPLLPSCKSTLSTLLSLLFFALQLQTISLSSILGFLDDMFDCLPLMYQQHLFSIVESQMSRIEKISTGDQDTVLRITNGMLRKIPRSENVEFRGRLQLLLSKILVLCHDSGMVKGEIAKTQIGELNRRREKKEEGKEEDWEEKERERERERKRGNQKEKIGVSHKLYLKFWGLQKYFADPFASLCTKKRDQQLEYSSSQQSPPPATTTTTPPSHLPSPIKRKLFTSKLKSLFSNISQILHLFANNPIQQSTLFYHQPVKHLTEQNILPTQLSDPHFRKLFLIQGLLFCNVFLHRPSKYAFPLTEEEKKMVAEAIGEFKGLLDEGTLEVLESTLEGEKKWIHMKDNWKDTKSRFKPIPPTSESITAQLNSYHTIQTGVTSETNVYGKAINPAFKDLYQEETKLHEDTLGRLNLNGDKMREYVEGLKGIGEKSLEEGFGVLSFEYYWREILNAGDELEQGGNMDGVFEDRKAYSLYEWKAMRALAREVLGELRIERKEGEDVWKEYKLVSVVKKKERVWKELRGERGEGEAKEDMEKEEDIEAEVGRQEGQNQNIGQKAEKQQPKQDNKQVQEKQQGEQDDNNPSSSANNS